MLIIKAAILWILLFIASLTAKAQNKPGSTLSNDTPTMVTTTEIEKIYLHLDRDYYFPGDNIWYKAYLIDANDNKLSNHSNILYVELISPVSKIIKRNRIRMENGTGTGDFSISDSLPAGKYQVRAYTNWMLNFSDYFIFKKEIEIVKPAARDSVDPSILTGNHNIKIQFFPEGGSLVDGVPSKVGFKANGGYGIGSRLKGKVINSKGDTCAAFESNELGMGFFTFVPFEGAKYHVLISNHDTTIINEEFPSILETGYAMEITGSNDSVILISIKTNDETLMKLPNEKLILTGEVRGTQYASAAIKMKKGNCTIKLLKKNFPEGIIRLTIRDSQNRPWCERLVYNHIDKQVHVTIKPDKEFYAPREKVTVQIITKDPEGKPISSNLSLSAIDANLVKNLKEKGSDICSYFMFESDIRGNIENPYHYFDTLNLNRVRDIDILLLTQGWRDFIWKNVSDSVFSSKYPAEKGINISGKLNNLLTHKPKKNTIISLGLINKGNQLFLTTQTDSLGKYRFDDLDISGSYSAVISAFNKKHRAVGQILVDSVASESWPVSFHPAILVPYAGDTNYYEQEIVNYPNLIKGKALKTIVIKSVDVDGIKKPVNYNSNIYYSNPDWSAKITDLEWGYTDLFQYLNSRVPGVSVGRDSLGDPAVSMRMGSSILFLLDDNIVDIITLSQIPMVEIERIDIQKRGGVGLLAKDGIISVYTKKGGGFARKIDNSNSITKTIEGYYEAREFYAPDYEAKDINKARPDLRTTLYWQPMIKTDENGQVIVTYFNDDKSSLVQICVEGMAGDKNPVASKVLYQVK